MISRFLLFLSVVFLGIGQIWGQTYELVTSNDQLEEGAEYIILGQRSNNTILVMTTTQNNNNRAGVVISGTTLPTTLEAESNYAVFELGLSNGHWTFYDAENEGFLYAASSSSNQLKTRTYDSDGNSRWEINIGNDNIASVVAQGDNTRKVMQLNNTNGQDLFSCYGSASQAPVYLYKKVVATTDPILITSETEITGLGYMEGNASVSQSFVLSGENLDGSDVTVTAPANFEVSTTEASGYASALTLTAYDGTETTIWVRLAAGQPVDTYAGNITISGGGASDAIVSVVGIVTAFSEECGFENFNNAELTASYADGSFVGNNGITWTYAHSRNEGDYPIDGKGLMLRNAKESYLEATISGGIGTFSFDYRKAFTGNNARQLELLVDGVQVATTDEFGGFSGEDDTIYNLSYDINTTETVTIKIKNVGETTSNRQTVIDNITWTCYTDPCEGPANIWNGFTWSNGSPETANMRLIFEADYDSSTDLYPLNGIIGCSIEVKDGVKVFIDSEHNVIIDNEIRVAPTGSFTLRNDANLLQINDVSNEGHITVERFVRDMNNVLPDHMDYVYWSSPVTGQWIHDGTNSIFSPGTPKNRNYEYHEPTDYFVPTPDETFIPGKGYAIRAETGPNPDNNNEYFENGYDKTYTFTGIPNNGLISIPIKKSPDNPDGVEHGYNLVGNPYPSNIDADVLFDLNVNQIEPVIYLWTNNITEPYQPGSSYTGDSYAIYNPVGGVPASENTDPAGSGWSMNEVPDGIIKVGQGFIIQAKEGANSLQFQNMFGTTPLRITDKGTDKGFFFQKNLSQKDRFWLEQKSPLGMINSTLVGYVLGATNEFEKDYDAPMLTETSDAIYTVIDSIKLRIQGRSFPLELTDVVPLGLNHFEAGVYTIGIRKVDGIFNQQSIYLRDKQKEIVHNLSLDGEYVYEANAGELTDRFEIIFQEDEVMSTSDLLDNSIKIYHTDQNIVIESEKEKILSVEVYDLNGRKVHSKDRINSNLYQIRKTSLATQVFVVKVLTDGGKVETRKIINQ